MAAKLTLKLDSEVIEKAKVYAEDRGELGGVVAELAGLLAGAEIADEKEAYAEYLAKKYS